MLTGSDGSRRWIGEVDSVERSKREISDAAERQTTEDDRTNLWRGRKKII